MNHLFEADNGTPYKFRNRGQGDSHDPRDLAITKSFGPQMQAGLLLAGQAANCLIQMYSSLRIEKRLFRIAAGICLRLKPHSDLLFGGGRAILQGAVLVKRKIRSYGEKPRTQILNAITLANCHIEFQESFLRQILRFRWIRSHGNQVTVDGLPVLPIGSADQFPGGCSYFAERDSSRSRDGGFSTRFEGAYSHWLPFAFPTTIRTAPQ
jgi:hypothetical protein